MLELLWHRYVLRHRPRIFRVVDPDKWEHVRIVQCSCRKRPWIV